MFVKFAEKAKIAVIIRKPKSKINLLKTILNLSINLKRKIQICKPNLVQIN